LPLEALAKELGCSRLDALREKRACWAAAAPFVHPKLSTVEIKPVGSPAGDPVDLPFAAEIEGEVVDVEPSASPAGEQLELRAIRLLAGSPFAPYKGSLHESALSVRHLGRSMNGLRAGMSAPPLMAAAGWRPESPL
jgi:hypothetical protein